MYSWIPHLQNLLGFLPKKNLPIPALRTPAAACARFSRRASRLKARLPRGDFFWPTERREKEKKHQKKRGKKTYIYIIYIYNFCLGFFWNIFVAPTHRMEQS